MYPFVCIIYVIFQDSFYKVFNLPFLIEWENYIRCAGTQVKPIFVLGFLYIQFIYERESVCVFKYFANLKERRNFVTR